MQEVYKQINNHRRDRCSRTGRALSHPNISYGPWSYCYTHSLVLVHFIMHTLEDAILLVQDFWGSILNDGAKHEHDRSALGHISFMVRKTSKIAHMNIVKMTIGSRGLSWNFGAAGYIQLVRNIAEAVTMSQHLRDLFLPGFMLMPAIMTPP